MSCLWSPINPNIILLSSKTEGVDLFDLRDHPPKTTEELDQLRKARNALRDKLKIQPEETQTKQTKKPTKQNNSNNLFPTVSYFMRSPNVVNEMSYKLLELHKGTDSSKVDDVQSKGDISKKDGAVGIKKEDETSNTDGLLKSVENKVETTAKHDIVGFYKEKDDFLAFVAEERK